MQKSCHSLLFLVWHDFFFGGGHATTCFSRFGMTFSLAAVMPRPAFAQFGMTAPQSTSHGHLPAQNYFFEAENALEIS